MSFSHTWLKNSHTIWNLLKSVRIKMHAHTCVPRGLQSYRELVLGTSVARPPDGLWHFVGSLDKEESGIDPFSHVKDDLKNFSNDIKETLGKSITDKEMHTIATYMYTGQEGRKTLWINVPILVGKALNHHVCNVGNLTETQSKIITISDLLLGTLLMHDDVIDNSATRRGRPSANVVWYPYKSIVVGNMILATCLSELVKLNNPEIRISMAQMYEHFCRGQYMQCQKIPEGKDRMEHYLEKTNYKSGGAISHSLRAMAQAIRASEELSDVVTKYAQNVFNVFQLLDDLMDFEADLKEGVATAPVIFASREHPVLEEMMSRNFQQDGDVEKVIELVKQSGGLDAAKNLARKYLIDALGYAKSLEVSSYQKILEAFVHYYMYRLENATEQIDEDDWSY